MDIIIDEEYNIKTPLSYQLSEYDCGQATLFNAVRFLYKRYVLATGMEDEYLYVFDPYYLVDGTYDDDPKVIMITNKPFEYNRIVSKKRFEEDSKEDFSLVKDANKQIVLFEIN